jgi:N-dimethylarginine dimethylaminohydrolase
LLGADVVHEGAGDALPFAGTLVGGYRTGSSASAYVDPARLVPAPILPVELVDERFYHLDLSFCPLDTESALAVPSAMDPESFRLLAKLVPDLIELSHDEAGGFCANSIVVGRTVVMSDFERERQAARAAAGFEELGDVPRRVPTSAP